MSKNTVVGLKSMAFTLNARAVAVVLFRFSTRFRCFLTSDHMSAAVRLTLLSAFSEGLGSSRAHRFEIGVCGVRRFERGAGMTGLFVWHTAMHDYEW